ncbi:MAG: protein kinase [Myxococcales bacterium]
MRNLGPLTIGTRVNQFEIRAVLGEGGTAVVYEALHTKLNSPVALKVVNMEGPHGPNAAARLRREAALCAAVEDPHVPKVYDVGTLPDGTPYLVMEKVVGPTLENLLSRGRLGLRLGALILRDLLRAVEAVQRAGVVHRDIKPANIIVQFASDRTPSVRLMDFGVSRSLFFRRDSSVALTRRGTIIGTPEYMAPEQIQDHPIDVRTDVYALGVVAYEMFSGRVPFEGEHPAEIVAAVLRREHQPLYVHRTELPSELVALIERAMESIPMRRFKSARAMRDQLEAQVPRALWGSNSPSSLDAPAPAPAPAARKTTPAPRNHANLALGTSLVLAIGAGIFSLVQLWAPAAPTPAPVPVQVTRPVAAPELASATTVRPSVPTMLSAMQAPSAPITPPEGQVANSAEAVRQLHKRKRELRELVAQPTPAIGELPAANTLNEPPREAVPRAPSHAFERELKEVELKSPFAPDLDFGDRKPASRAEVLPANPYE